MISTESDSQLALGLILAATIILFLLIEVFNCTMVKEVDYYSNKRKLITTNLVA